MAGPRSPTSPVITQIISRRCTLFSSWSYADCQQRSNQRLFVLPQTRSSSFHGVKTFSRLDDMKLSKNIQSYRRTVLYQTRPSSFQGVEKPFRLNVMQQYKISKFLAGPRSPTSFVTAQLISRRWKVILFWCYAVFWQRSNQRLVVLPQTRSSSFYGVKQSFRLDGMKFFKNVQNYGWAVLLQTRPNFFHGFEKLFRFDVMQPVIIFQVYGWAAFQHPLPRPRSIRCVEKVFRSGVMQIVSNVRINGWSCSSKHDPAHFTVLSSFVVLMV